MAKTLTIILNSDRDLDFCLPKLRSNLLNPLDSDLAICGSFVKNSKLFKYEWGHIEPSDWSYTLDNWKNNGGEWRKLNEISLQGRHLFSLGADSGIIGSGAIVLYWRDYVSTQISLKLIDQYDWFVFTRSDFFWDVSHPPLDLLDISKIYIQDSSYWRGVPDRHFLVPSQYLERFLSITNPIFSYPLQFLHRAQADGYNELNIEQFFAYRLSQLNLIDKIEALPQMGYLIRTVSEKSRWSFGEYNSRIGAYVKYIDEYRACRSTKDFIKCSNDWNFLVSPIRNKLSGRLAIHLNPKLPCHYGELLWRPRTLWIDLKQTGFFSAVKSFSLLFLGSLFWAIFSLHRPHISLTSRKRNAAKGS